LPGLFDDIFGRPTLSKKRCFSKQEFTRFLSTVSSQRWAVISRIWKKILSDFKWAGHRLAHTFADGWSTGSHKRKVTLLEAPTGTLLFYYKNIKQEIVHTLLLEEYGVSKKWVVIMDRRQDLT